MGVSGARRGREKERRKNYLMCLGKKEKREKGKIETERGGVKEGGRGGGGKGYGYPTRDNSSRLLTRERASRSQKEQDLRRMLRGGWWRERYRNQDLR